MTFQTFLFLFIYCLSLYTWRKKRLKTWTDADFLSAQPRGAAGGDTGHEKVATGPFHKDPVADRT